MTAASNNMASMPGMNMASMPGMNMQPPGGATTPPATTPAATTPPATTPAATTTPSVQFTFKAENLASAVTSLVGLGTLQSNLVAQGLRDAAAKAAQAGHQLDAATVATYNLEAQKAGDFSVFSKKMDDERRKPMDVWLR
jgi:hypothetical protein